MSLKTIKKAIFDNDGVNIDSEDIAMQICEDFIARMVENLKPSDLIVPNEIYGAYAGTSTNKIVAIYLERKSLPLESIKEIYGFSDEYLAEIKKKEKEKQEKLAPGVAVEEMNDLNAIAHALAELITKETNEAYAKGFPAIRGITKVHEQVRNLLGKENVYLATTSPAERMNISLAKAIDPDTGKNADLLNTFPEGLHRTSGYGQPNKYDYIFKLAEEAGEPIDPDTTVVVEDSLNGVKYAKAGRPGLRVIGTAAAKFFPDKENHARDLIAAGASVVVTDMRDLPEMMKWLDTGLDPDQRPKSLFAAVFTPADFDEQKELAAKAELGNAPRAPEVP